MGWTAGTGLRLAKASCPRPGSPCSPRPSPPYLRALWAFALTSVSYSCGEGFPISANWLGLLCQSLMPPSLFCYHRQDKLPLVNDSSSETLSCHASVSDMKLSQTAPSPFRMIIFLSLSLQVRVFLRKRRHRPVVTELLPGPPRSLPRHTGLAYNCPVH